MARSKDVTHSESPTTTPHISKDSTTYLKGVFALGDDVKEFFMMYSGIPKETLLGHVEMIRDKAWAIHPYPCIGGYRFLDFPIIKDPHYPFLLEGLKTDKQFTILDVGCCFGSDLRRLAFDAVNTKDKSSVSNSEVGIADVKHKYFNLYGLDLHQEFFDLSYELYLDHSKFPAENLLVADVLDNEIFLTSPDGPLSKILGRVNVVYAASFFHLFTWSKQVQAACFIVQHLLAQKPGSLIIGRQNGSTVPREIRHSAADEGCCFMHNEKTWAALWNEVCDRTGITVKAREYRGEDLSWMEDPESAYGFEKPTRFGFRVEIL